MSDTIRIGGGSPPRARKATPYVIEVTEDNRHWRRLGEIEGNNGKYAVRTFAMQNEPELLNLLNASSTGRVSLRAIAKSAIGESQRVELGVRT
jgi:hypothetical protein